MYSTTDQLSIRKFLKGVYNTFETTKISKLMTTVRQYNDKLQSYEVGFVSAIGGQMPFC